MAAAPRVNLKIARRPRKASGRPTDRRSHRYVRISCVLWCPRCTDTVGRRGEDLISGESTSLGSLRLKERYCVPPAIGRNIRFREEETIPFQGNTIAGLVTVAIRLASLLDSWKFGIEAWKWTRRKRRSSVAEATARVAGATLEVRSYPPRGD